MTAQQPEIGDESMLRHNTNGTNSQWNRDAEVLVFPGMRRISRLPVPSAWSDALEGWSTALRAAGHPETTIGTRTENVRRFARHSGCLEPWAVSTRDMIEWCGRQSWATETRRGMRNSFVQFYRWALAMGHVDESPAEALPAVKPATPAPRPAPLSVYHEAMAAGDERTQLILRLGAEVGLRRGEIALVHSNDLVEDLDGWSLVVHGKGAKTRMMPLPAALAATIRSRPSGWLFPGDDDGHLSPRYVGKLATRALPGNWTLHTLRHQFGTRIYQQTDGDVFTVQDLLGHASPVTTRTYVRIDDARKRRAVQGLADVS